MSKYIIDNIEISSDYDRENSDEENSDEKNSDEENSDEKQLKNTHMVKLIFKAYKKTVKISFYNLIFFPIYKNVNRM